MNTIDTTLIAAIICGILFPMYILITSKKTIRMLETNPDKLPLLYKETMILLLVLGFVALWSMNAENVPFEVIGLGFIFNPLWVSLLVAASLVSFFLIRKIEIPQNRIERSGKSLEGVQHVLPKNSVDYKWMIATSFVAGVFEEIIFRGFLVWILNSYMHLVIAIVISNVLFAIAHASSKLNNAIKAFGLGLFFSATYCFTGSLWLAILTHIVIDLYAATFSYKFSQLKTL